jgi:hypothetical protein
LRTQSFVEWWASLELLLCFIGLFQVCINCHNKVWEVLGMASALAYGEEFLLLAPRSDMENSGSTSLSFLQLQLHVSCLLSQWSLPRTLDWYSSFFEVPIMDMGRKYSLSTLLCHELRQVMPTIFWRFRLTEEAHED